MRPTELSACITYLCRYLRQKGYALSPTEEAEALQALQWIDISSLHNFQQALKVVLVKNRQQFWQFDEDFNEFWKQLNRAVDSKVKEEATKTNQQQPKARPKDTLEALKNWLGGNQEEERTLATYSPGEVLTKKDFSTLNEAEAQEVMQLLKRIAQQLAHQKSRLRRPSKQKKQLDLKRSIRHNMRRGGTIEKLILANPKTAN